MAVNIQSPSTASIIRRRISGVLRSTFEVDLRALAFFRMALGGLLICDLWMRVPHLKAFYTDEGMLPRSLAVSLLGHNVGWSTHLMGGGVYFEALLFAVAFLSAAALACGYKTRTVTLICWFHTISLCSRNPKMLNGGDNLLWMLLFWSIFLPLGGRFSLDARKHRPTSRALPVNIVSIGTAALLLQVAVMYWETAFLKSGPEWRSGDALYYALSVDFHCKPFARTLLQFPDLLKFLTHSTLIYEYVGPFLLLYPFRPKAVRLAGAVGFAALHLGIASTMRIGLFPYVDIAALIPFIPTACWDRAAKWTGMLSRHGSRAPSQQEALWDRITPRSLQVICGALLVFVLWWNVGVVQPKLDMPGPLKKLAYPLKFQQKWTMFAPSPSKYDGWFVVLAIMDDGSQLDLFRKGAPPVDWKKPEDVSASFESFRHKQYMIHMLPAKYPKGLLSRYCAYMRSQWQKKLERSGKKLNEIRLYFMVERTLPNDRTAPVTKRMLWRLDCRK